MKRKNEIFKKTVWIMAGTIACTNFLLLHGAVMADKIGSLHIAAPAYITEGAQIGKAMLVEPVLNFLCQWV